MNPHSSLFREFSRTPSVAFTSSEALPYGREEAQEGASLFENEHDYENESGAFPHTTALETQ